MEDRYSSRVPVECPIIFAGETVMGEGRVIDVSSPGCLMESSQPVRSGDYLRLKLFLPDGRSAISIPLAVVRWVKNNQFGVEFIRTSEVDEFRIKRFVRLHQLRLSMPAGEDGTTMLSAVGDTYL